MTANILIQRLLAQRAAAAAATAAPKNILEAKRREALAMTAPARALAATGVPEVLKRLGLPPVTPEYTIAFAPAPWTAWAGRGSTATAPPPSKEEQVIAEVIPVLERLGMPVGEPTIGGIEAAIGRRYEAPIHEGVPFIGGMDVKFPDILGGMKNTLIIAAVAIGGLFILGKYIGKGK